MGFIRLWSYFFLDLPHNNLHLPYLCDVVIEIHMKAEDILRTFYHREIKRCHCQKDDA